MNIGIAGTGKMGTAIGSRLLSLGHPVTVWNRTAARAQTLLGAGAHWAESPKALAESVDVVITLLTNEAALDDVYGSASGLLSGDVQNKMFIDMSTVRPAKPQEMAKRAQAVNARFLECPVGGSVGPAKEGKLLGFVGGDAQDLHKVQSLLDVICRRVEHVGQHGAGATMKLAVNLPLMVYWQTLGEALSLVEPLGLDPKRVIDILSDSSGGPNMLKVRGAMIAQTLSQQKSDQVTVSVATMRKDMRTMLDQGQATQKNLPLTTLALKKFESAAQTGLDDKDCSELLVWWLSQGGRA
ncbi:3-hydroxyisobutyrate dehydrogenase [Limnohabitans sp. 2KL-17]|uniref:NAD(P)-dependent oxidoreductase n=1 Tax=Limnohabitans sp. 2KL-17 TaxID=1100704 RepID=UPI000D370C00|nr:NAD(P)-dependent oxidoreductase [Limnohabitans sp. 2KL-17]PUE63270.1 3-hydroxyisobutyrate dehydrogenase [Limnohabitans sp. 2KL-17]